MMKAEISKHIILFSLMIGCDISDESGSSRGVQDPPRDTAEDATNTPPLHLSTNVLDFGMTPKGCEEMLTLTLTNNSTAPLEISSVRLEGERTSAFRHNGDATRLPAKESIDINISFLPTAWLTYEAELHIRSDTTAEQFVIPLTGQSEPGPMTEEVFTQRAHDALDVLWVVDNSNSMSTKVGMFIDHLSSFTSLFITEGVDYQMALITTDVDDPDQAGRFQGDILTPATPSLLGALTEQFTLQSSGSSKEQGLLAIQIALTEPRLSGENSGFLREDAHLEIIVLSDEDDSSSLSARTFVGFLRALKPAPTMVGFNGLLDFAAGTFGELGKYADIAEATGGMVEDMAREDTDVVLHELSFSVLGFSTTFPLQNTPETLATTTVVVDDRTVPMRLSDGWSYDSQSNAIVFWGDAVPANERRIRVTYPVRASCE